MRKCSKCGNVLKEDQKFCIKCGTKIEDLKKNNQSPEMLASIDILQKKISRDDLNSSLYIELGDIYFENKMYNEAISEFQRALAIDKNDLNPIYKTCEAYRKIKDFTKAEKYYKKTLEIDEKSQIARLGLFWSYYDQNKLDELISLEKEIIDETKTIDFHKAMIDTYKRSGKLENAFKEMEIIYQLVPDDIENLKDLAEYFDDKNNSKKVFELHTKILSIDPKDIDSIIGIGKYHCYAKDYIKTIELFEMHLPDLNKELSCLIKFYLSYSYFQLDKTDKAINIIQKMQSASYPATQSISSKDKEIVAEAFFEISVNIEKQRDLQLAISHLEKAIEYVPENQKFSDRLNKVKLLSSDKQKKVKKKKLKIVNMSFAAIIVTIILIFSILKFLNVRNENIAWEQAQAKNTEQSYEDYIAKYPNSKYRILAIDSLQNLNRNLMDIDLIYVKGGTYQMGSNDGGKIEKPIHTVIVSDFYIGKYEVTQKEWKDIMGNNPSNWKGYNLPVENVSWKNVQKFIKKLNTKTGWNYRLPTEAEWEYAARGGNKSNGYKYSGSNDIGSVAWYNSNSNSKTHSVGGKKANELGIYDMSGNVWEWCNDWKGSYSSSSQTNPKGASSISYRVYRGGCWINNAENCRVANRNYGYADVSTYTLGFRLTRSAKLD